MFKYNKEITFQENTSHGELLKLISRGERILEFGCAKGELAGYIKERLDGKVWGIELDAGAFELARANLEGGVVCDIENYEWEKELEGIEFDTLLFADVLEHLHSPADAIKRALPLLKDDGKIIFSVPNIAHADIVLKLLNNRFDYTDIGLLDNTHIHFFAKENLVPFCEEAGIFPTYITGTSCPLGFSEQGSESSSLVFENAVRANNISEIYQFIVCACKSTSSAELSASTLWRLPSTPQTATVFFDCCGEFSKDNSVVLDAPCGEIKLSVDVPKDTRALRVDLREDSGYIIDGLVAKFDGALAECRHYHHIIKEQDSFYIFKADSQLIFSVPENAKSFDFSARLSSVFDSPEALTRYENAISSLDESFKSLKAESTTLEQRNSTLKEELVLSKRRASVLETDLKSTKTDLSHYKLHYEAAINQRNDLEARLAVVSEQYRVISSSQFWRLTKPLRLLFDLLKWPFRHIKPLILVKKFFKTWKSQGFKTAWRKATSRKSTNKKSTAPLYTDKELEAQRSVKFERDIKFSILVPLYNTPERFLCEMIDSVIAQTYSNWELCLADGSDEKHDNVEKAVMKYAKKDSRIVYKRLEKNLGISGNTNACIEMSTGDYISLFDHDDLLHPSALYNVMEAICEQDADFIYTDENTFHNTPSDAYCPHFKPDYAPDTLRTNNYICHFTSFDKSLLEKTGVFRPECDGSQDYDMVLRLTEQARKIVHIPKILYYWRAHAGSVATDISAKPYVIEAAHKALRDHLDRVGLKGEVMNTVVPSIYRIKYEIPECPLVSIIIANKDHSDDLKKCIDSITLKTTYKNYEIVVVENNSVEKETFDYYEQIKDELGVKIITWVSPDGKFNYSAINNLGVKEASGDYIILLNNDTEIITPEWIEEMLMFAQRSDVGAVGAKLYYPDNTIQHAGLGLGLLTLAGHYFRGFSRNDPGYMGRLIYAHNVTAVTAACVMLPRKVWNEVGGLDESFEVAFNDVDLCMKVRAKGYLIVFTPFCELYHYESKSRGLDSAPEKRERFVGEVTRFQSRWAKELAEGDPYYNPNFTLDKEDFSLR